MHVNLRAPFCKQATVQDCTTSDVRVKEAEDKKEETEGKKKQE